jgi:antitoxin (DNA-binding transcriptional repressor) of toxin-antitoxin stability system
MEIGIEQARKTLGDLANRAQIAGETTYLTRNGRRIARIAPLEETVTTTTEYGQLIPSTDRTITTYIADSLGDYAGDYDIPAIVDEFRDALNSALPVGVSLRGEREFYGPYPHVDVNIAEAIDGIDFWAIAARHEHH